MKKKLFTLLSLLMLFVCGVSAQIYKSFEETTVFYTDTTNCKQGFADKWMHDGTNAGTFSHKAQQSMTIDPVTDGDMNTKLNSLTIKQANGVKALVVYVKGITEVKAYTKNTNGSETRKLSMDITADGGTTTVTNPNAPSTCVISTSGALDATKEYKITFYASGDLCLYALKFIVPSGPSSDATIKSLTVNDETLTATDGVYSIELPNSYTEATVPVVITPNSDKAVVTVSTDINVNIIAGAYQASVAVPSNVTITVTPETGEGDAVTYTLNVTKAATASSDNSLASVTLDGEALTADTDGNYTKDIPFAYAGELLVAATATDAAAEVNITNNTPTIVAGAFAVVTIKVTAENKGEKEYTVTINRIAASTACELTAFSINGFAGTIDGRNVTLKVVEGYDFSHTPVMSVSSLATAAWDKDTQKVTVTAESGAVAEYTVSVATEYIQPYTVESDYELSFAAETYTNLVEWIYGAPYNQGLAALETSGVGGYELKKENDPVNIAAGTNILNIYLSKCATLTLKVGATGGRNLVAKIGNTECGKLAIDSSNKNKVLDLACTVNSADPVVVSVAATGATGGTRIYGMSVTSYQGGSSIDSEVSEDAMVIYAIDGMLHISAAKAQVTNVYGIDGRLVKVAELVEGDNAIDGLAKGMYLVNNQKVVIK